VETVNELLKILINTLTKNQNHHIINNKVSAHKDRKCLHASAV